MAVEFKKGDLVRVVALDLGGLTARELTFLKSKRLHTVTCQVGHAVGLDGWNAVVFSAHRFELAHASAQPYEQVIATEYEVIWHATKDSPGGCTDGRVLSRRPTREQAEQFIERGFSNYANGEFGIREVTTLKRVKQVRRVVVKTRTVHELADV